MGAPPVNWEAEAEAEVLAEVRALVAAAAPDEALEAADEATDATTDETATAALEASEALDETTDAAAEVALATADEAAPAALEAFGISMGAPASWHVFCTAAMVAAWSLAGHAFWTQGCTVERSWAPFWQWHLKSLIDEQPSDPRGPRKQDN
jgi:hypothetical protein